MLKKVGVVLFVVSFLFILGCSSENLYLDYAVIADFPADIDGEMFVDIVNSIDADSQLIVISSNFEERKNPETGEKRIQYTITVFNKGEEEILLNEISACYDEDCNDKESVVFTGEDLSIGSEEVKLILLATKEIPLRLIINHDYSSEDKTLGNMNVWYYSDVEF